MSKHTRFRGRWFYNTSAFPRPLKPRTFARFWWQWRFSTTTTFQCLRKRAYAHSSASRIVGTVLATWKGFGRRCSVVYISSSCSLVYLHRIMIGLLFRATDLIEINCPSIQGDTRMHINLFKLKKFRIGFDWNLGLALMFLDCLIWHYFWHGSYGPQLSPQDCMVNCYGQEDC